MKKIIFFIYKFIFNVSSFFAFSYILLMVLRVSTLFAKTSTFVAAFIIFIIPLIITVLISHYFFLFLKVHGFFRH